MYDIICIYDMLVFFLDQVTCFSLLGTRTHTDVIVGFFSSFKNNYVRDRRSNGCEAAMDDYTLA